MKSKEMAQEQISAFADGELADAHIDMVLASLRQADSRAEWDVYHQIGDILRSDEMAAPLSADFSARMAARLDTEPTIIAPMAQVTAPEPVAALASEQQVAAKPRPVGRFIASGMMAAAAAAAVAFVAVPQWMSGAGGKSASLHAVATVATVADNVRPVAMQASADVVAQSKRIAVTEPDAVVLRDPRIDEYLLAHQRFSPSVYSTAQYARATFATDTDK